MPGVYKIMQAGKFRPDPRYYQLSVLATLSVAGVTVLGFPIRLVDVVIILLVAQLTQFAGCRLTTQRFDPRSAMITALSLILLLRASEPMWFAIAASLAIGSKFLVRINHKHVFNPANSAIVALMLLTDDVWVSTGQWGNTAIAAFALACCGFLVLTRAKRAETTLAFLIAYAVLLIGRTMWLGDPLAIPVHQLQNGALLLFAFFMISDPRTAPDAATGRLLYGTLVAAVGFVIQFNFYKPYGPLLALFLCAPMVPLIDVLLRGVRYRWDNVNEAAGPVTKEPHHASTDFAVDRSHHIHP